MILGDADDTEGEGEFCEFSEDEEDEDEDLEIEDAEEAREETEGEAILRAFSKMLEPLHKDILKINRRLTRDNRKMVAKMTTMETKYEVALTTIASMGQQIEYLVKRQATQKDAPPPPPELATPTIPTGNITKPTLWSTIAAAVANKDPPKDKKGRTLNPRPLTKKQRTLVIARHTTEPVKTDLNRLKLAINATLRRCGADPRANIGHISTNYKNNLVLLTTDTCPVELVLAHKTAIEETVKAADATAQSLKQQETWSRVMIHCVDIHMFPETETGMNLLKEEIELNNSHIKLTTLPRSLTRPETRPNKQYTTMVVAVRTEHEAQLMKDHGVQVNGRIRRADRYITARPTDQCTGCQQFGHSYLRCKNDAKCNICAGDHTTTSHTCGTCPSKGKQCTHDTVKCANCAGPHKANDQKCPRIISLRAEARTKFMNEHTTNANV
jgi:hypothetical protein